MELDKTKSRGTAPIAPLVFHASTVVPLPPTKPDCTLGVGSGDNDRSAHLRDFTGGPDSVWCLVMASWLATGGLGAVRDRIGGSRRVSAQPIEYKEF